MSDGSLSGRGYGLDHVTYVDGVQDGAAVTQTEYRQFIEDLLDDLERLADQSKNADRPPYAWEMIGNVERFAADWRSRLGDL